VADQPAEQDADPAGPLEDARAEDADQAHEHDGHDQEPAVEAFQHCQREADDDAPRAPLPAAITTQNAQSRLMLQVTYLTAARRA
jgi:hypothetical protein